LFILHTKTTDTRIIHDLLGKQGGRRGCHLPADKNFSDSLCNKPQASTSKKTQPRSAECGHRSEIEEICSYVPAAPRCCCCTLLFFFFFFFFRCTKNTTVKKNSSLAEKLLAHTAIWIMPQNASLFFSDPEKKGKQHERERQRESPRQGASKGFFFFSFAEGAKGESFCPGESKVTQSVALPSSP